MILHEDASFKIYFGDIKDDCVKSDGNYNIDYFEKTGSTLNLEKLVFLKQVHGNSGVCVDQNFLEKNMLLFELTGDYIVTNKRNIGIGVLTADCLPVVFYDPVHHALGIVHSGWRGAISNIIENCVEKMRELYQTNTKDLTVYFGACANVCCYEIQADFFKNLETISFFEDVIIKKEDKMFFDLSKLVAMKLMELGVLKQEINFSYNNCTICDERFHSYRRNQGGVGRQSTIISLK
ncbi:peptidoglycan editing factor PgeF [Candidatus Dependentiae bacterium]|nr:peptidoglycan editing factor PgeF [Candidatus Dependentiae bacterium]MBU4386921.1 peptidoglycan editing factor PgeF [Candidatus Dependentiae bacterium]MCG2756398.1 peptidoglycan editing factor PgeF [Candidatus Dependentiae bacterium]